MQVVLVMFRADGERRSFSIVRDMTVIGRREDCDLRIPLGDISRKHCRLIKDGEALRIEDLGSSNGTFLNGERVQESIVNPGDTVQLGPVVFGVQIDGFPSDEELQPYASAGGGVSLVEEDAVEAAPANLDDLEPTAQSDAGFAVPADDAETFEELEPIEEADDAAPQPQEIAEFDSPDVLEPEVDAMSDDFDVVIEDSQHGDSAVNVDIDLGDTQRDQ